MWSKKKEPERIPWCEMTDHLFVKSERPVYGTAYGNSKYYADGYLTQVCVICFYTTQQRLPKDESDV